MCQWRCRRAHSSSCDRAKSLSGNWRRCRQQPRDRRSKYSTWAVDQASTHHTRLACTVHCMPTFNGTLMFLLLVCIWPSGRYSLWLRSLGHVVDLLDPVPLHIEQAVRAGMPAECARVGDARDLSAYGNAKYDLVLLQGPLYHLPSP